MPLKVAFSWPTMFSTYSNNYSHRSRLKKWQFSGPNMCNIFWNTEYRSFLFKSPLLKKWYFLDLVCSVHVTGISYSNRSRRKKWYLLHLICSVPILAITIEVICRNRSFLKKWHYLDLVCSVHVVAFKNGCCYRNRSCLKKWTYLDLVCSVHVVTMTTGLNYRNRICLKKWHFLDLICAYQFKSTKKLKWILPSLASLGRAI